MKRFLRYPATNALCLSLFTAFYSVIFIKTSGDAGFIKLLFFTAKQKSDYFWDDWSNFLAAGYHLYIALALIVLTVIVIIMLMLRRHPYDEYHTSLLSQCLAVASVLTLIAIAVFYLMILGDPNGIVEKFTLFIVIHWATVVLADLVFVVLCRWR